MPGTTVLAVPCFVIEAVFTMYVMRIGLLGDTVMY